MMRGTEDELLALFHAIHGPIQSPAYSEVLYDEYDTPIGVACMKGGQECWRASLGELAADWAIFRLRVKGVV